MISVIYDIFKVLIIPKLIKFLSKNEKNIRAFVYFRISFPLKFKILNLKFKIKALKYKTPLREIRALYYGWFTFQKCEKERKNYE